MKVKQILKLAQHFESKVAGRPTEDYIFPPNHRRVNDGKGHFPIPDVEHARSALSYANHYDSSPEWYDGPLDELVGAVCRAVRKKFESIEVSEESCKPGKG